MPRRRSSIKRKRADKKRRLRNIKIKQQLKKVLKKFQALLTKKDINEARASLGKVFSLLDKAAKKRIIHPQTANRKKSRLAKRLGKTT